MLGPRSLERRFSEIERRSDGLRSGSGALSGDGTTTFLRDGNFEVTGGSIKILEGGAFEIIAPDGKRLASFDKDAVTFFDTSENPLAVLDRSGVEVGPAALTASGVAVGPTTLSSSGLSVGSGLVLDATGLKIDGVLGLLGRRRVQVDATHDPASGFEVLRWRVPLVLALRGDVSLLVDDVVP